jgi:hypothetical protein
MSWPRTLTREELLGGITEYRDDPEFTKWRDLYLRDAVHGEDLELVKVLLDAGAGPDVVTAWSDSLQHYLVERYLLVRSTNGDTVIAILEALLSHGANPEHIGSNNRRGIDLAIDRNLPILCDLFIRYGADPKQREFM